MKAKEEKIKRFPNLIDKYALSDKKIEEQEELFKRNKGRSNSFSNSNSKPLI